MNNLFKYYIIFILMNSIWIEKYRPTEFKDILGQNTIINCLKKMIKNKSLPHMLFHGNSGTGKTTTILTIINKLYGSTNNSFFVMKLNASNNRGINTIRKEVKGFAEKKVVFNQKIKIIILDEVDSMTYDAQFALRRIIEKYSDTTRFFLICNYINKIIPAIRSRCLNFRFNPINTKNIFSKLKSISISEKLKISDKHLNLISLLVEGDIRKAINILQTLSTTKINEKNIYNLLGYPDKKTISIFINNIFNTKNDLCKVIKKNNYYNYSQYNFSNFIKYVCNYIIDNNMVIDKLPFIMRELAQLEYNSHKSFLVEIYFNMISCILFKYR